MSGQHLTKVLVVTMLSVSIMLLVDISFGVLHYGSNMI
jgi:hypothetical protein